MLEPCPEAFTSFKKKIAMIPGRCPVHIAIGSPWNSFDLNFQLIHRSNPFCGKKSSKVDIVF
jgi:hypothetical protein